MKPSLKFGFVLSLACNMFLVGILVGSYTTPLQSWSQHREGIKLDEPLARQFKAFRQDARQAQRAQHRLMREHHAAILEEMTVDAPNAVTINHHVDVLTQQYRESIITRYAQLQDFLNDLSPEDKQAVLEQIQQRYQPF